MTANIPDSQSICLNCIGTCLHIILSVVFRFKLLAAIRLCRLCAARILKISDHIEFKCRVTLLGESIHPSIVDEFVNKLMRSLRVDLYKYAKDRAASSDNVVIMSTAAPDTYALALGKKLGFNLTLATQILPDCKSCSDNKGEQKVAGILESLAVPLKDLNIIEFYSDHYDDLPIMYHAKKVFLIEPKDVTIRRLQQAGFSNYELCRYE